MTYTYSWKNGREYCASDIHSTDATCYGCVDNGTCAACDQPVADGPAYLYCTDNGEVIHPTCKRATAEQRWEAAGGNW